MLNIPVTNGHQVCLISATVMGKERLIYWADYTSNEQGVIGLDKEILYGEKERARVTRHYFKTVAIIYCVCCALVFLLCVPAMTSSITPAMTGSDSAAGILEGVLVFGGCFAFWPAVIAAFKLGGKRTKIMAENVPIVMKLCEPMAIKAMWPEETLRLHAQAKADSYFLTAPAAIKPAPLPFPPVSALLLYALSALFGLVTLWAVFMGVTQASDTRTLAFTFVVCLIAAALGWAGYHLHERKRKEVTIAADKPA